MLTKERRKNSMSIELVANKCALCRSNVFSYLDLGQKNAPTFLPQLADPSFIANFKDKGLLNTPGIRLVVAARAFFLCFECIEKALTKSEPAIIT
jgi:hypothetical protein